MGTFDFAKPFRLAFEQPESSRMQANLLFNSIARIQNPLSMRAATVAALRFSVAKHK